MIDGVRCIGEENATCQGCVYLIGLDRPIEMEIGKDGTEGEFRDWHGTGLVGLVILIESCHNYIVYIL